MNIVKKIFYWILKTFIFCFDLILGSFESLVSFKKTNKNNFSKKKIVLLHGWFATNIIYVPLKHRLERLGYEVILPPLGWYLQSIKTISQNFGAFVEKSNLKSFTIIGHSCGGLVGLYYAERNPHKVEKIITFGTPFKGTHHASLARYFSPSARQMQEGSTFLQELVEKAPQADVEMVSLIAAYDEIVPKESSIISFGKNIQTECFGHASLLYSKTIVNVIKNLR